MLPIAHLGLNIFKFDREYLDKSYLNHLHYCQEAVVNILALFFTILTFLLQSFHEGIKFLVNILGCLTKNVAPSQALYLPI